MLVNNLQAWFRKYIYARHIHDWHFEQTTASRNEFGGIKYTNVAYLYKCDCGKVAVKKEQS